MKHNLTKFFAAIAAVLLSSTMIIAQEKVDDRPYNLQKAYEVLKENRDEEQALRLLGDQLKSTPDNVECLLLMCKIHRNRDDNAQAMTAVNSAIKVNKPQKSGYFNSTLYWWKASIYNDMGMTEKTAEWLTKALAAARKDNKENVQPISLDLAQAYYELDKYDEADAVYRQMLKENEADQAAMTGLARNMIERGDYSGAVKILDNCQKYDSDYLGTYRFRYKAYDKMGETDKAIDDAILLAEKDEDAINSEYLKLLMKHYTYSLAKVKTKVRTSENKALWKYLLVLLYEESCDYENAIKEYDAIEAEYGKTEAVYARRANCYMELGMTDAALSEINKALELEEDYSNLCTKGDILRRAGQYTEALNVFDKAIDLKPSLSTAYYVKGWCHELSGDDDKALECYNLGIDLDKEYAYLFLMRGEQLLKRGMKEQAEADFNTILQLDTTAVDGSCRQYALHFLGRDSEAIEWMQKIIENKPYDAGNYYDKACLYSLMNRPDEAVDALKRALEMGYCSFAHIEHDDDMDAIRERDDFKGLIQKYKAVLAERVQRMGTTKVTGSDESHITEVPIFRKSGGTFNVDCSVNGLALNMIFDTGASDVSLSKVEADFMLKNNYLSANDIKGKQYYQNADGGIAEGTVITLREVKIGDAVLHNVAASVTKNQVAPLLLGQSVLEKFGTITIDNINNKLLIKQ